MTLSTTAPSQAPGPIVRGYENQPQVYSPAGAENQDGASLTNDGPIVYPDDYTLQCWQKVKPFKKQSFIFIDLRILLAFPKFSREVGQVSNLTKQ